MNSKKILASLMALTLSLGTVASFTGCSSDDSDSKAQVDASKAQEEAKNEKDDVKKKADEEGRKLFEVPKVAGNGATLKVYTNRTDRVDDGTLKALAASFEKEYNCTVEFEGFKDYSGDIKKKMTAGDYGDVLAIPEMKVTEYAEYLEPLGTYDEFKDTYRWINEKMDSEKNVYGVPTGGTTSGILYNKSIWKDAGIEEMPTTPEAFIDDLKKIAEKNKDKDGFAPYYTNYGSGGWCTKEWSNAIIGATGDPAYKTKLLQDKTDLFAEDGGYYKVFKFMTDLYSNKDLIEEDYATTDWDQSKVDLPAGNIGCMVLGHWAISQFTEVATKEGYKAEDVGYMPFPITAPDGKQYAQVSPDYSLGVSKNSKNKELAKAFVHWFAQDSGYAKNEFMIPTLEGSAYPDCLSAFSEKEEKGELEYFSETPAPEEYTGAFDEIEKKAGVLTFGEDATNFNLQIAQSALDGKGEEGFKKIADETNKKWAKARDEILKEKGLDK